MVLFFPGILLMPAWLYLMTEKNAWEPAFTGYWPMSLAMIAGSFIAGSTPLGGAVIAFPVAVLVVKFKPDEGRDFAVLIQSIGMVAAAYLIALKKRHMVDTWLVQTSCIANTLGVILGFSIALPGFWVNVAYMTYAVVFAGVLVYKHAITRPYICTKQADDDGDEDISCDTVAATAGLFLVGIAGGILASKMGSGSDTVAYVYGLFIYNPIFATAGKQLSESSLTVSSVVIMAYTTVVVAAIRLVQGDISVRVYHCWGAAMWVVVFGAPMGSYVLHSAHETFFRRLFYCLAVAQFVIFAALKVKGRLDAWLVILGVMVVAIFGVMAHYMLAVRGKDQSAPATKAAEMPSLGSVAAESFSASAVAAV